MCTWWLNYLYMLRWYSAKHQATIWKRYLIIDDTTVAFLSAKSVASEVNAAAREIQQDASNGGY